MDFSGFTDAELRSEIAAMEFALSAPGGKVFDDSEVKASAEATGRQSRTG